MGAVVAVLGAGALWINQAAYKRGVAACEARIAAATDALNDRLTQAGHRLADMEAAAIAAQREAQRLQGDLDNAARADPSGHRCFSSDRVLRLDGGSGAD
ncbi:MAG: hypothetical protein AAFQ53_12005 [Bacteroidota bacterium]